MKSVTHKYSLRSKMDIEGLGVDKERFGRHEKRTEDGMGRHEEDVNRYLERHEATR